jgi:hypothetical protein
MHRSGPEHPLTEGQFRNGVVASAVSSNYHRSECSSARRMRVQRCTSTPRTGCPMDIDHLFVPGQLIVSFRTKPRGFLSWFGFGAENMGVVVTSKDQFINLLRSYHSMPRADRDRSIWSITKSLNEALANGLPMDGKPHPDLDDDIVLAFGLRLIDGPGVEAEMPVHRLGIMLRSMDDVAVFGIPEALIDELSLKM